MPVGMNEEIALLALHLVPNLGPVKIRRLRAELGSAYKVLQATSTQLRKVHGISPELDIGIRSAATDGTAEREIDKLETQGGWLLTDSHPLYPQALRQLQNAPVLLEAVGTLTDADRHAIGIVGSRHCSYYGMETTKRFSFRLASAGLTIVSGLARGIDTAAHQAALAAKGRTLAIIGSGIGQLYPPENQTLAQRITQHGAILSEFPFDSPPNPQTFPYRNRIVAGWSTDLLVVEAGEKSGAIITANLATDQGRQVYAVPGPIDRESSAGTNRLIQQGAKLVTCAEDILEEMQNLFHFSGNGSRAESAPTLPLPPEETAILEALATGERPLEEIISNSGLTPAQTIASLLSLELKQRVRPLPGQWFTRT
jgi:DNA processing protein